MSHQQPGHKAPSLPVKKDALPPFITDCHRVAIAGLGRAFDEARPLAVLIGEGTSAASFVIGNYLDDVEDGVAVARITEPCSEDVDGMREIVRGIGFDPKEMGLDDLENIFSMFLIFQRTHNRRTIICIEQTENNGRWVLDRICRLVDLEIKGKYGLMVILSGRPDLIDLLDEPPLNAIREYAQKRIVLAPFSATETKEYVRRRVEAAGTDVGQVFTFNAVMAIQEMSSGLPDDISKLCSKCLELADLEDSVPVTTALVTRAAKLLRLASAVRESDAPAQKPPVGEEDPPSSRLVVLENDEIVYEQALKGGHYLIGRDTLCDLRLDDAPVSRHHALIIDSSTGVKLVDLRSRNGTFVNGLRIRKLTLKDNDRVTIGACKMKFLAGDEYHSWLFDVDATQPPTRRNGNGLDMQLLNSTRSMIPAVNDNAQN